MYITVPIYSTLYRTDATDSENYGFRILEKEKKGKNKYALLGG